MTEYKPGDVALVRSTGGIGHIVSLFSESPYCHIRLITDNNGSTVEANPNGAATGTVHRGDVIVSVPLTDEQRTKIPVLAAGTIGTPYNFLDIFALMLAAIGLKFGWLQKRLERSDRLICSQLVDVVWHASGFRAFTATTDPVRLADPTAPDRLPQDVKPGDIADLAFTQGWKAETV